MPIRSVLLLLSLCLCLCLGASQVLAQAKPVAAEPSGYRAAIDAAVREFGARNFVDARAFFAEAHALFPNARTQRGLGLAEFELRAYVRSIDHLAAALASGVRPLNPAQRKEVETLLSRAKRFVGLVRLKLDPEGATVTVDGIEVDVGSDDPTLRLDLGDHVLDVSAPGRLSTRRQLRLAGGDEQELVITLLSPPPSEPVLAQPPAPSLPSIQHDERPLYGNPWLWTAVGVVIAGAGVATALVVTREGDTIIESPYGGNTGAVLRGP